MKHHGSDNGDVNSQIFNKSNTSRIVDLKQLQLEKDKKALFEAERRDPEKMHLMKHTSAELVPLDEQINRIPQFPIDISKKDIKVLMEQLEELNARLVDEVNNGEQESMMMDSSNAATRKEQLAKKIQITEETIVAMKKHYSELIASNDILMAPKRAAMREAEKRSEYNKNKPKQSQIGKKGKQQNQLLQVGIVLPDDHPEIPKICGLIKQIYTTLHDKELMDPRRGRDLPETAKPETTAPSQKTKTSQLKVPETGVKTTSITESGLISLTQSAQTAGNPS